MNLFAPPPTKNQTEFYDNLSTGKVKRRLWSLEKRFSPEVAVSSPSFRKYFLKLIEPIFNRSMKVLDVGCGTGMYLPLVAPLCKSLIGIELSGGCAKLAQETILKYRLYNTSIAIHDSASIGLKEKTFDAAICVDSLHHIYHLEETLREIARLVKPNGDIVIFEPNAMNPALFALCLLDRNEWGALSRCYRGRYESLFLRYFNEVRSAYNGLLIGPQGKFATTVADILLAEWMTPILGRFSPKLFYHMKNR